MLIGFAIFVAFFIITSAAGTLETTFKDGQYQTFVKQDGTMIAAAIINVIAFLWFTQFLIGCQHFIIAGTAIKWYFTRDKTRILSPIKLSFYQLIEYHLGSVCFGSMVITIVKILKLIGGIIKKFSEHANSYSAHCLASCCATCIEYFTKLIEYLVRNTYIIIAKEGTPFIKSGKRASTLLLRNIADVVTLNKFGDLVLLVSKFVIVILAGLFGYLIMVSFSLILFI